MQEGFEFPVEFVHALESIITSPGVPHQPPPQPVPKAEHLSRLLRRLLREPDRRYRRVFLPLVAELGATGRDLQRQRVESARVDVAEIMRSELAVQWQLARLRVFGIAVFYLGVDRWRPAASAAVDQLGRLLNPSPPPPTALESNAG